MVFLAPVHFRNTLRLVILLFGASFLVDSFAFDKKPAPAARESYPHAMEPIGTVRQMYDGVLSPDLAVNTFRNIDRLFPTNTVNKSAKPLVLAQAPTPLKDIQFNDRGRQISLEQYLALNRIAGLLILKDGKIKLERYQYGNNQHTRWMSMSIAKSITSTLIGVALKQGKIASLNDPVTKYIPTLKDSAYRGVLVRDVLTMSSGVRWNEAYTDPTSDRRRLLEAQISQQPGAAMMVMKDLARSAEPGTTITYNTGETQVAAQLLRNATGKSLASYLSENIWSPFGMEANANWWLDSPKGVEIGGSGFSATLRDYGRFGLFMLAGGMVGKENILPAGWTTEATTPKQLSKDSSGRRVAYGYLWWPGRDVQSQRDSAYMAIGIHGQYLYINPKTKVVIVVWGAQSKPTGGAVIRDQAFFDAVSAAL